ncbi:unnamed protein product [Protopolystoma xenopodis]|uniref:Uncharacterized protein n=1 Tax=Protopolystoma xenopodis TaxID=117903 RepID=A0A448XMF0_9PLAT|nr:unnamed protein product [Protopolystoma xenopodis]
MQTRLQPADELPPYPTAQAQVWKCHRRRHYRGGMSYSLGRTERVTTLTMTAAFRPPPGTVYWDASTHPRGLNSYPMVRITMTKSYHLADSQIIRDFEQQCRCFISRHESVDDFLDVREGKRSSTSLHNTF